MWVILQQEVLVRNMELISHHQQEEFTKGQKETPYVWPPPRILLTSIRLGWAMCAPPGRTLKWERLVKGNPETNPITIKPEIASREAKQLSWVPFPYCSPPGRPFPITSLPSVSPQTVHFWMLDRSPVLGLGSGVPFLQHFQLSELLGTVAPAAKGSIC